MKVRVPRGQARGAEWPVSLRLGLALLGALALLALLAPLLHSFSPIEIVPEARLAPPSLLHPFGADALGRDLLARVAAGAVLAARMALEAVGLSLAVGLALGSLAGYFGGRLDQALSRAADGWLALPGALVAVVIVARLGPSLDNLILALGLMSVPGFYRVTRNSSLSARRQPYVEAAVALGASHARIMWRHILPNILPPLVVFATMRLGTTLLTGSSLSFVGLGAQPPQPEWGALLSVGRSYLGTAWWLAAFPGLAVTAAVVGLNLMGDGLSDLLDPHRAHAPAPEPAARTIPRAATRPAPVPVAADEHRFNLNDWGD